MRALRWSGIDSNVQFRATGAWAEEVDTKPAFLVPLDNSYDWKKTATGKQPYAIALADRSLMALAGLWETWRSPAGERVRSLAIITTTPNELCAELHNRMPVVLGPDTGRHGSGKSPPTRDSSRLCLRLTRRRR